MEEINLKNKKVETYTDDMVKAIETDKGGLIKKIIHEEEEHEALKANLSPSSKRNRLFMFVSILLSFLAFILIIFLVFFNKKINVVPIVQQSPSLIFIDQTDFKAIDGLNKDQIIKTVLNQISNTKINVGGVEGVYLTENKGVVGFKRFNSLIKSNIVLANNNSISDSFLLGAVNNGTEFIPAGDSVVGPAKSVGGDFFTLIKINSFSEAFTVMRNWENKMLYDLGGFFGINILPENNYLFTKSFEDGIIENKNARMLKDKDGNIVLMYVFVDDSSIIITDKESVVEEILLRLASSQIKK